MAAPSVTYTFSNSTTADATQVNTNFTDLVNSLSDGLKDLTISSLSTATIAVSGAATFNGTVALGNATTDDVTITGYIASDILPKTTGTASLGSATQAWEDIYLDEGATNGGSVYFNAGTTSYIQSNAAGTILTIGGFTSMVPPAAINAAGALTIGTNGSTTALTLSTGQVATFAGQIIASPVGSAPVLGAAATPNICPGDAGDTGFYGSGSNAIAIVNGGTINSIFTSSGNLAFANGGGIDFGATSNASGMSSEILSDYEEGTYTPADNSGASLSFAAGTAGFYTKVGRDVHVWAQIIFPATASGAAVQISLPFTSANTSNSYYGGAVYTNQGSEFVSYLPPNSSSFYLRDNTDTGKTNANLTSKFIIINFTYSV